MSVETKCVCMCACLCLCVKERVRVCECPDGAHTEALFTSNVSFLALQNISRL